MLAGAVAGLGLYMLVRLFVRPRPRVDRLVERIDRERGAVPVSVAPEAARTTRLRAALGARLEAEVLARGWRLDGVRRDLAILGRGLGPHLASKVLLGVGAFVYLPVLWLALGTLGLSLPPALPAVLALLFAALGFVLPDLLLRGDAARRRADFRHVVGSFLDLVAMNLAGGRGLPEALMAASSVGDHWALARIRQALANARLVVISPWEGLGRLGDEIGVEELRDLAGALALASDDGAKIRTSLTARAATMRRKELSDVEGRAGERAQSMLVAQLLICSSFLVFLAYPATYRILGS
jgi:Flp pilus assembly protein TadB